MSSVKKCLDEFAAHVARRAMGIAPEVKSGQTLTDKDISLADCTDALKALTAYYAATHKGKNAEPEDPDGTFASFADQVRSAQENGDAAELPGGGQRRRRN